MRLSSPTFKHEGILPARIRTQRLQHSKGCVLGRGCEHPTAPKHTQKREASPSCGAPHMLVVRVSRFCRSIGQDPSQAHVLHHSNRCAALYQRHTPPHIRRINCQPAHHHRTQRSESPGFHQDPSQCALWWRAGSVMLQVAKAEPRAKARSQSPL